VHLQSKLPGSFNFLRSGARQAIHEFLTTSACAAQAYWDAKLRRLDVPLMKMLKRQVRHFAAGAASSNAGAPAAGAVLSITAVFQTSQPVNVRWLRLDDDSSNARSMIPVAGPLEVISTHDYIAV